MKWMNLEPIIQSEVNQENDKYINVYTWNLERWCQWFHIQGIKGDTDVKNRLLHSVQEGEGGKIWENCIEMYTRPYVK